jgi:Subtilase family
MKMSVFRQMICAGFILLLAACSSTPPEAYLEILAPPLKGLKTELLIDPTQGNCPIDEFKMLGEGLRAKGVSGGIAVVNDIYPNMPTALAYPTSTGRYVRNVAWQYGKPKISTGILIVDDFQGGIYRLGIGVFKLPFRSYNTQDPILRAQEIEAATNLLQTNLELSHGALVFNHTAALLVAAGYTQVGFLINESIIVFTIPNSDTPSIYVHLVDTEGFDTQVIAERAKTGLDILRVLGASRIAVNMSFSIVPCSVLNDFTANRLAYPTFQSYAAEISAVNSGYTLNQVYAAIRRLVNLATEPLWAEIKSQISENTLFVSAAGNYGLTYPMYPAAWQEVISVSSHDVGGGLSSFSNRGEIMITGAWFRLTNPAGINGGISDAPNVVYAGTSFAAPAVTVFTAYDLAHDIPQCGLRQNQLTPDLAYGPPWRNIRLAIATKVFGVDPNAYCAR